MQLDTVTAIVTGAASGLGRCFTTELVRAGARVAAGDIDEPGLSRLAAELDAPDRLMAARLDVTREDGVKAFVQAASEKLGAVNTLVNNAGILRDGLLVAKEAEWTRKLPTAQWKAVIATNLTGPYLMTREVVADMLDKRVASGLVVNISSVTSDGNPGQSNYAASKAGLDANTRTWALELAPHGIRVGGIAPGVVDTPILGQLDEETRHRLVSKVPLGRIGRPTDIWLALKFIIECDYFSGRTVAVDGGVSF
jgi:3-oxoacyl-[acyl-carrier protein] reductase